AVAAVSDVDVALRIRRDAVRRMELAGLLSAVAPGFQPVAVLVDLCDPRVDVAIADIGIARRIPGDVGDLAEAARLRRQRRIVIALERPGFFIGRLLLAAK